MNLQYQIWIDENYPDHQSAYGKCNEATIQMQHIFPELKRIRGHYYCAIWGERQHWWLIDSEDQIIDPTARQFPTLGRGVYQEFDERQPEPTGICPNCGEYCYNSQTCCSDKCFDEYRIYVMGY